MGERTADLQALGALIQAVITYKPVDPNRDWSLERLETFAPLGSRANAWREFCGKLLGVGTQLAFTDLSEVAEALKILRPRSGLVTYGVIPAAVLLAGGAIFSAAFPGKVHNLRRRLFPHGTPVARHRPPQWRGAADFCRADICRTVPRAELHLPTGEHAGSLRRAYPPRVRSMGRHHSTG